MDKFWKILTIVIVGFIFMGVLLHAKQASTVFGTLFQGVNNIGKTLEA